MTDHGHEDQTCPFGELNLGVGLPNWGKTQMQHDRWEEGREQGGEQVSGERGRGRGGEKGPRGRR